MRPGAGRVGGEESNFVGLVDLTVVTSGLLGGPEKARGGRDRMQWRESPQAQTPMAPLGDQRFVSRRAANAQFEIPGSLEIPGGGQSAVWH